MRLGVLGGTFDPVHRGHIRMARAALGAGLDRVLLVPARRPPHKEKTDMAGPFDRFALVALATVGERQLGVSAHEMERDGPSYTIETVRHFTGAGHDVTLVMGTDSLAEIETWRDARELVEMAGVLAYPRRPLIAEELETRLPGWVRERLGPAGSVKAGSIGVLDGEPEDVSSTLVRGRVREGMPIGGLVPEPVEEYILKNALYTDGEEYSD